MIPTVFKALSARVCKFLEELFRIDYRQENLKEFITRKEKSILEEYLGDLYSLVLETKPNVTSSCIRLLIFLEDSFIAEKVSKHVCEETWKTFPLLLLLVIMTRVYLLNNLLKNIKFLYLKYKILNNKKNQIMLVGVY